MLYIASDHAGFPLKEELKKYLSGLGIGFEDLGASQLELGDDYPDFAAALAQKVSGKDENKGILICGTGQGMCLAANKFKGIRAALAHDEFTALAAIEHLNANILCLGARVTNPETAKKLMKIWLEAEFSGDERHKRRLEKIEKL
ncbi:MAG: ribose 5-phosphate isomerase B [Candidatus Portnoybacteria bacterium]|nr:ribose 5-phosphate isomerase B [Candidatus Portnoybacteria bacterium]